MRQCVAHFFFVFKLSYFFRFISFACSLIFLRRKMRYSYFGKFKNNVLTWKPDYGRISNCHVCYSSLGMSCARVSLFPNLFQVDETFKWLFFFQLFYENSKNSLWRKFPTRGNREHRRRLIEGFHYFCRNFCNIVLRSSMGGGMRGCLSRFSIDKFSNIHRAR